MLNKYREHDPKEKTITMEAFRSFINIFFELLTIQIKCLVFLQ